MFNLERAAWQRQPIEAETRLSVGGSALVILVLSALCWAILMSMAMVELASLF